MHGVINTNEGDIAPIWTRGDIDEAIDLGNRIGRFAWRHHPGGRHADYLIRPDLGQRMGLILSELSDCPNVREWGVVGDGVHLSLTVTFP